MGKLAKEFLEHLLELSRALFLLYLLLAGLAVIFGRCVGYEITPWICLVFAVAVTAIFSVVVLGNLLLIAIVKIFRRLSGRL